VRREAAVVSGHRSFSEIRRTEAAGDERKRIRQEFAEVIIANIEDLTCEPAGGCEDRLCPDCWRHDQARRYIDMIRKLV
jgi:hypothetical protein